MKDLELYLTGEAMVFGLLGRLLHSEPDAEEFERLAFAELFNSIPFGADSEESQLGLGLLRQWQDRNKNKFDVGEFERLKKDYFYLFQGVGIPLAAIWESVYFTKDRTVFSTKTLQVREWYKRYSLQVELKNREPDDHLGLELQFVSHLASLAASSIGDKDTERVEKILADQHRFIEDHPLSWANSWCDAVQRNAETDFFKGIAYLSLGVLKIAANTNLKPLISLC
jgi:TorA maturation chaperone TorD